VREQWIKEGRGAIKWSFAANAVRLQLHALAYNLGNFLRTLATPEPIKDWSLTSLKGKLIKIGAKIVSHGRYVAFQMAEIAIPRNLFAEILRLIAELRPPPAAAPTWSARLFYVRSRTKGEARLCDDKICISGAQSADVTGLGAQEFRCRGFALPESVESAISALSKVVIRRMSA
jgi:hypothetical protein